MEINEILEKYEYEGKGNFNPEIEMEEYLIKIIAIEGPITRTELSKLTDIPRTTIFDAIEKLIFKGKIEKFSANNRKRGRPKIFYQKITKI